jgi:diguanylate cyclase (GGDEF)-like protein
MLSSHKPEQHLFGGPRAMSTARLIHGVAESTVQRDRDRLDQAIATLFFNFLGAHSVVLFHIHEAEGERRVSRRAGVSEGGVELGAAPLEDLSTLPRLCEHPPWQECVDADRVVEAWGPEGRLTTAFPLHARGEILGILVVESENSLPVSHIDLLHGILRIVENHLALLDYGERDTLTGLLNRKTFENRFEKTRDRLAPVDGSAAAPIGSYLALVDIDRFKSINDSHGHLFGDEVLLLVSQLMRHNFRGADQLFRFGGEEFVIVLEQATEAGARIAFERFRTAIEAHNFPQVGRVTVSLGYTRITARDVTTTSVERADGALYYAKSHGRNQCCNYEALVATGELVPKAEQLDAELF